MRNRGAHLTIEIMDFESVEVGDMESPHPQPDQGQQVVSPHTSHARNGNAPAGQRSLLLTGQPAYVARKGIGITKHHEMLG